MKSYGKSEAMDRLYEIVIGEQTASKQWEDFKYTRGVLRVLPENFFSVIGWVEKGVEGMIALDHIRITEAEVKGVAVTFGEKVKIAVENYAKNFRPKSTDQEKETVPSVVDPTQEIKADWADCSIEDLSPGQASLYLGNIVDIVKFINDGKPEEGLKTLEASEFMKTLLIWKKISNAEDLLKNFEKDLLFPLSTETN
ncbi:hypothetical protein HHU12_34440 [Flammeovirga aprica JL-4]|uniref:Uncharacterized protein n=2 Tax=Flammeovirga aprica TaxID=29528 RepID=A0A7X9S2C5_9BACT|nr:hypothetical protein [Flammeovirga aprica JL-4]